MGELITHVTEVVDLASELPKSVTEGIRWDLDVAFKAIVQEKKPPKIKVEKPSLVVDIDEFELDYY